MDEQKQRPKTNSKRTWNNILLDIPILASNSVFVFALP
jgi:hypothetical protein